MTELKPCPHCGDVAIERDDLCPGDFAVQCVNDECGGTTGLFDDPRDAVAAWNRRALEPPTVFVMGREEIARTIDRRWWDLHDTYLARGVSEYSASATADSSFAPDRRNALAKADAIISLLGNQGDSFSNASPSGALLGANTEAEPAGKED